MCAGTASVPITAACDTAVDWNLRRIAGSHLTPPPGIPGDGLSRVRGTGAVLDTVDETPIIAVFTDGLEYASRRRTMAELSDLITARKKDFFFMGATRGLARRPEHGV